MDVHNFVWKVASYDASFKKMKHTHIGRILHINASIWVDAGVPTIYIIFPLLSGHVQEITISYVTQIRGFLLNQGRTPLK